MVGFLTVIGAFLVTAVLVTSQNLTIFFTKYHRQFLVRRLWGAGLIRTYREYGRYFVASWLLQGGLCWLIIRAQAAQTSPGATPGVLAPGPHVLAIGALLMILEAGGTSLLLLRRERRNMAQAIKEGM